MHRTEPEPRASDWNRIEDLFHTALELAEAEQERWLEEQTAGEPAIRNEVKSLLAAQKKHEELSRTESAQERRWDLGERLLGEFCGPYRLERLIGQGGMAWVYEGARVAGDFSQRVAVKVLPAIFGKALSERFRREKQILADLSHPGIARLLDGGVNQSGLSYLVMEYVEGEPISCYVTHHQLSRRDRIWLFLKVCEAVEFAHTQRVIHRDIKPANILVTSSGQPKAPGFRNRAPARSGQRWTGDPVACPHPWIRQPRATPWRSGRCHHGRLPIGCVAGRAPDRGASRSGRASSHR